MKTLVPIVFLFFSILSYGQSTAEIKKLAESGVAQAQYELGMKYFNGNEVLTDKKKAAFWIRNAFDNGYAKAKVTWDKLELWKYFDETTYVSKKGIQTNSIAWTLKGNAGVTKIVMVKKGDRILIEASGSVMLGGFAGSAGPNGLTSGLFQNYNEVRGAYHGALLCRIGYEGYWVNVGEKKEFIAETDGSLNFIVNDAYYNNNSGEFKGTVTIITQ